MRINLNKLINAGLLLFSVILIGEHAFAQVTLYEHENYQGRRQTFYQDTPDLSIVLTGDSIGTQTSSLKVPVGCTATLYRGADYQGQPDIFPQDDNDLGNNLTGHDAARSLRVDCKNAIIEPAVTLFEHVDFAGHAETFYIDVPDLARTSIGSATSSIHVPAGCVAVLYENVNYQGTFTTFTNDNSDLRPTPIGNDRARSLKVGCEILINNRYISSRSNWALFPLGYWSVKPDMDATRVERIKQYNFNSILLSNNSSVNAWDALRGISSQLNKVIVQQPNPVFVDNGTNFEVKVQAGYSGFHNAGNLSFLLVDEPFVIDLFDPNRNRGVEFDGYSISTEQLAVNQHLFFYGYSKEKAEQLLTETAKRWATIYSSFNAGSIDPSSQTRPPTLISLSGANSRKPTFHNVVKHLLDRIIRDKCPSCFSWTDNSPVPSDDAMEKLARFQAYKELAKNGTDASKKLDYETKKAAYEAQFTNRIKQDIHDSLFGTTYAFCLGPVVLSCGLSLVVPNLPALVACVWSIFDIGDTISELLGFVTEFQANPLPIIANYLENVPTDKLEFLQPYDILFREFRNSKPSVKLEGVLTHIYSLRDAAPGLPAIYTGFPFQGKVLDFSNKRDLFTYVSRPIGLSAITKTIETVRKNMDNWGYGDTPLFFTYQLKGSGTGQGAIYEWGATDARNVNAEEIRAMINLAYLSGANGAFGWTDYGSKGSDVNSGLFNAGSDKPALDIEGTPRVAGVMSANQDIMDTENYLNWSVGANRTVQILSESTTDDFWIIKFQFDEKPISQFWAVMNRRASREAGRYVLSAPRSFILQFDILGYAREAKFPASPVIERQRSATIGLAPGQFRMFEVSAQPFTETRENASFTLTNSPAKIPDFLFTGSGNTNSVEIGFNPGDIAPPYSIRIYLENGINRVLLHEEGVATDGSQIIRFDKDVDSLWPLTGNRIVLAVESPRVLHQEVYKRDVTLAPGDIDSDGDGLTDHYEVYESHTDRSKTDSDGDGLRDYHEVYASHTDPNKRDTDGDLVDDDKDVFPLDPLRWSYDISPALGLLLLGP